MSLLFFPYIFWRFVLSEENCLFNNHNVTIFLFSHLIKNWLRYIYKFKKKKILKVNLRFLKPIIGLWIYQGNSVI
jgi:hypothetical protein